jgi:hypothetical protein
MAAFLATLSAKAADNWTICKRHGLWGTASSSHATHAVRQLMPSDLVYVWLSGKGLLAKARATTSADEVRSTTAVPWPEPERYRYTFGLKVLVEFDEPIPDRFKDHRSIEFGLRTHELQAGLIRLDDETARRLEAAFPSATDPTRAPWPPPTTTHNVTPTPAKREPHENDRRHSRPLAGVYLRPAQSATEALLALYRRVADDPDGELLVVGDEAGRAAVEGELGQEPFTELRGRVRFVTADQLADEIRSRFSG